MRLYCLVLLSLLLVLLLPASPAVADCGTVDYAGSSGWQTVQVAVSNCPSSTTTVCSARSGRCYQISAPSNPGFEPPAFWSTGRLLPPILGLVVGVVLGWLLYRRQAGSRAAAGVASPS